MDSSFDQFAGGGWGDQGGEQEFISRVQKTNIYEKLPMPVTIEELATMPSDEEKYHIGGYSFHTIRVMGKVVSVHINENQCTTYELCDAFASDHRIAKRFVAIWYTGTDNMHPNDTMPIYSEGQMVQAVGKLSLFNNRLSLVSFCIREAIKEEIEIYKMECKLAKYYFEKNLSEKTHGLENTIFRTAHQTVTTTQSRPGTAMTMTGTKNREYAKMPTATPSRAGNPPGVQVQIQNQPPNRQEGDIRVLSDQQKKICEYILHNGNDGGVHIEQIRAEIKPNNQFDKDMEFLQNDGKIYTTMDDEHFSIVTNT